MEAIDNRQREFARLAATSLQIMERSKAAIRAAQEAIRRANGQGES